MKSETMTVRLSKETKARIARLAQATHRSQTFVVDRALEEYLEAHEWQVMETVKAVELADSDQAQWNDHSDVKAKWEQRSEN